MKRDLTSADSKATAPAPSSAGAAAASPIGPDRRAFICGAMLAGSVVAIGWPVLGTEEADWSDGTAWSDGLGWSS